jgi:hypothetical protein
MTEKIRNIHNGIIYPRHYKCKKDASDRDWIISRMSVIPSDKQKEVSDTYEEMYLAGDRNKANTWLRGLAKEYRVNG